MTSVHSIDTIKELERFFDAIYGNQTGYVYSPTKNQETEEWKQQFFEWPAQKQHLIKHVVHKSESLDVYCSPALYDQPDNEKPAFKGTHYVWAEFDGKVPTELDKVPEPSIKIQSSTPGHEHWYWRLEGFVTEIKVVEDITQRLAYHLKADIGCWNANRVLRPPNTVHHESGKGVVVLRWDDTPVSIGKFVDIPKLPVAFLDDTDIKLVPDVLDVIFRYKWEPQDIAFFRERSIAKGHRSSALTKLCFLCIEMGMNSSETLSILLNADNKWKKFANRNDQKKRLIEIINYCKVRKAVEPQKDPITGKLKPTEPEVNYFQVYNFGEFMSTELQLKWLIPNLIHEQGLFCISGPPGTGKSQFSLRLCERFATNEKFLIWKPDRPTKTLFVSMEMPHAEVKYFMKQMQMSESDLLKENFLIMPIGFGVKLGNKMVQAEINAVVEQYQPDVMIIDSLGVAIGEDINSEKVIFDTFAYVNQMLRAHYGVSVGFVHHPRKGQIGNKKPNKLDDLFGSQYIAATMTTAISMFPVGSEIEVDCLKLRMAPKFNSFRMKRTPGINFSLIDSPVSRTKNIFGSNLKKNNDDSGNDNGDDSTELGNYL